MKVSEIEGASQYGGQLNEEYEIGCKISPLIIKCIETFEADTEVCIKKSSQLDIDEYIYICIL